MLDQDALTNARKSVFYQSVGGDFIPRTKDILDFTSTRLTAEREKC